MKRIWRVLLTALLTLSFVLSPIPSVCAKEADNQLLLAHGLSNAAYEKIMDYFNLTYGFHEYPDYYGGCIIGEDGNLIVQLIRDTPEIRSLFTSVSQYNKLSFAVVTNTYYDIMHEYDYWLDLLQNNLTEDEQLKYAISQMLELYIDENNNTLTFGLVEDDPQIQSVLAKNALKPSVIRFEKSSEMVSNVTVNPGAQITVASGGLTP